MSPVFQPHNPVSAGQIASEGASAPLGVPRSRKKAGRPVKKKSAKRRSIEALSPRWQDLESGRISVADLDWEELSRGQLRNKNGTFTGGKPQVLPRAWHDELAKRAAEHGQSVLTANIDVAVQAMVGLAAHGPAREQLGAAQYIIDRVLGLMTQKSETKTEITVFSDAIQNGDFLVDLGESGEIPESDEQLVIEGL